MICYRVLEAEEITQELFAGFIRHQVVEKCWRKIDGEWQIRDIAFVDDWTATDYETLIPCLQNTVLTGGIVFGAFWEGQLKGFASLGSKPLGRKKDYVDLSHIYVSEDMRGKGIGRELFGRAKIRAGEQGAKKLYISAHSAVESQAFYRAMGCVEAVEYDQEHVRLEPCDCQLECVL